MRLLHLTPLLLLATFGCSSDQGATETDVWEPFAGALADTQRRNLISEINGQTYQISVALPENYENSNETYPILYAVDANGQFGTVVETARTLRQDESVPELIIIGIGYPVGLFTNAFELRAVDLCGRGDRATFLDVLRQELIPLVEMEYRAKPGDRALYGHSCGGGFALHALFEGQGTFERVIAGSPGPSSIIRLESAYSENHDSLRAKLFISSGLIAGGPSPENVSGIRKLVTILESRNYKELHLNAAYFEDETHLSVIPATISRGLRTIYKGLPAAGSE